MILTFVMVVIGLILFRADSLGQVGEYVTSICNYSILSMPQGGITKMIPSIMMILLMLVVEWLQRDKPYALDLSHFDLHFCRYLIYIMLLVLIFASMPRENIQFFYF